MPSKKIIYLAMFSVSLFCNSLYANPSALGFELGKATLKDIEDRYSLKKDAQNIIGGDTYEAENVTQFSFIGLSRAFFIFDDKNILKALLLKIDNRQKMKKESI